MAPELLAQGRLTEKVDVYSFGVLVLEIVSGVKNSIYIYIYTQTHTLSSVRIIYYILHNILLAFKIKKLFLKIDKLIETLMCTPHNNL